MKKNKIPKFRTEEEERKFWDSHDSTKYIDWEKAKKVTLPNLKPSMKSISIRFPEIMIEELKLLAHKRDIPYQSLIKIYISEKVKEDLQKI
ncbi:MAG: BrnA antitoxin family protein [Candidatus Omnitrophica bacterium]|nr:BrnA antitoxin family protein [Candidatus Omnitrophota bacterium]MCF7878914.1 BrnA antitoxin family protein [Candidatus Omnitrophota bacterium]MCF7888322.1 BrnA antitoxin family protein [Candidatus Omnitrophota bacterium]